MMYKKLTSEKIEVPRYPVQKKSQPKNGVNVIYNEREETIHFLCCDDSMRLGACMYYRNHSPMFKDSGNKGKILELKLHNVLMS